MELLGKYKVKICKDGKVLQEITGTNDILGLGVNAMSLQSTSLARSTGYVLFGGSDSPVTGREAILGDFIVSSLIFSDSSTTTVSEDGLINITRTYQTDVWDGNDVILREAGLCASFDQTVSPLFSRTVFESPITLVTGGTASIEYTLSIKVPVEEAQLDGSIVIEGAPDGTIVYTSMDHLKLSDSKDLFMTSVNGTYDPPTYGEVEAVIGTDKIPSVFPGLSGGDSHNFGLWDFGNTTRWAVGVSDSLVQSASGYWVKSSENHNLYEDLISVDTSDYYDVRKISIEPSPIFVGSYPSVRKCISIDASVFPLGNGDIFWVWVDGMMCRFSNPIHITSGTKLKLYLTNIFQKNNDI